jgi:hypothetical protein
MRDAPIRVYLLGADGRVLGVGITGPAIADGDAADGRKSAIVRFAGYAFGNSVPDRVYCGAQ